MDAVLSAGLKSNGGAHLLLKLYAVGVERGDPDAALEFLNYLKKNSDLF
jgi:hypothetical protein